MGLKNDFFLRAGQGHQRFFGQFGSGTGFSPLNGEGGSGGSSVVLPVEIYFKYFAMDQLKPLNP